MLRMVRTWWFAVLVAVLGQAPGLAGERTLVSFDRLADWLGIERSGCLIFPVPMDGVGLRMIMGSQQRWPGITLTPRGGPWTLGDCDWIAVDLRNAGAGEVTICLRVDGLGGDPPHTNSQTEGVLLRPGERKTLRLWFRHAPPAELLAAGLFGVRTLPGGFFLEQPTLDPRQVVRVVIFGLEPTRTHVIDVDNIRAGGNFVYPSWLPLAATSAFLPFVDRYGQFAHADWPGKTHSDLDLGASRQAEDADLQARPAPPAYDRFGGWAQGPVLAATGAFRPAKYGGRWWLVTPQGRLFFSLGVTCVGPSELTPVEDRTHYFAELPAANSPLGFYWFNAPPPPRGYYASYPDVDMFDFARANLYRKYGPDWEAVFTDRIHRRLRSWGFNTLGAWSDARIERPGTGRRGPRTAYTVALSSGGRRLGGLDLPDPFDPQFDSSVRSAVQNAAAQSGNDPWCIGYFIDNEIGWPWSWLELPLEVLRAPADQPAKLAFVQQLQAKYGTIGALNARWATHYPSWQALLAAQNTSQISLLRAFADLAPFAVQFTERYFRICREAVEAHAPQRLYLGCRFSSYNPLAVTAASRYCHVVSFNWYRRDTSGLQLPAGVDAPVLIGEYHFSALDRNPSGTSGLMTSGQQDRAAAFEGYVRSALRHPNVVGCHWFQLRDQPATGRFDGENAPIGFLDVCDNPYPEMVAAARRLAQVLYPLRAAP
ncbi:MAG: hypothetical protein KatS3mg102_1848 [Planctomycetota bacterium]|nr:MAG: hypothetical protein KatS3mg102_1848 [Planctomycetota bacterium]